MKVVFHLVALLWGGGAFFGSEAASSAFVWRNKIVGNPTAGSIRITRQQDWIFSRAISKRPLDGFVLSAARASNRRHPKGSSDEDSLIAAAAVSPRQPRRRQSLRRQSRHKNSNKQKDRRRRTLPPSASTVVIQYLEDHFPTNTELSTWMHNQINPETTKNNSTTSASSNSSSISAFMTWSNLISPLSWCSHDDTALIRYLASRQADDALLIVWQYWVRNRNVFTYTAVISALASSAHHRTECWSLYQEMIHDHHIEPSSYTLSALFQACRGPVEATELALRLQKEHPPAQQQAGNCTSTRHPSSRLWTLPVWESAIYACATTALPKETLFAYDEFEYNDNRQVEQGEEEPITPWTAAQGFFQQMKTVPSLRTYLALLWVCTKSHDWPPAKALYQELETQDTATLLTPRLYSAVLQVCAVTGEDVDALDILKTMQQRSLLPNVKHCTSYLKALTVAGKVNQAISFLVFMANNDDDDEDSLTDLPFRGIQTAAPDAIAIQTVLQSCNYDQACQLLRFAKEGRLGRENLPDEQFYNVVLSKCKDPEQAKDWIRTMHLSRRHRIGAVPPSKRSYTRAIAVCRKARDVDSARFFLDDAKQYKIEPDVYMYSAAIWAAAGSCNVTAALEFLTEMQDNDYAPNAITYDGVIAAFAAEGSILGALKVYDTMIENGLDATPTTYFHLASAARAIDDPHERIFMLERIWKKLSPRECTTKLYGSLLESLITTYGAIGRTDDALDLFDRIQGPCDLSCLRAVSLACSVASPPAWSEAVSILHASDIVGGHSPMYVDPIALSNTVVACSKANEWEEAFQLLELYEGNGISLAALNSLIAACGRGGRPDMALEVLNEIEPSFGLEPDTRSFRSAVIACNQAEHDYRRQTIDSISENKSEEEQSPMFRWWECALSLLRRMKESGLTPDIQTYTSVISACEAAGKWQIALGVLQGMLNDKTELNLYCFNAAIAACAKGGAWVEALELFERMKTNRLLQPTVVTYGSLILALDKAGQKELAVTIMETAIRKGLVQPWRTTRDEFGNKLQALDLHQFSAAMARACLRSHLEGLILGTARSQTTGQALTIVVGKGLHSKGGPVLLPTVKKLLLDEYNIIATVNEKNTGRLVLNADTLHDMIARKKWR